MSDDRLWVSLQTIYILVIGKIFPSENRTVSRAIFSLGYISNCLRSWNKSWRILFESVWFMIQINFIQKLQLTNMSHCILNAHSRKCKKFQQHWEKNRARLREGGYLQASWNSLLVDLLTRATGYMTNLLSKQSPLVKKKLENLDVHGQM